MSTTNDRTAQQQTDDAGSGELGTGGENDDAPGGSSGSEDSNPSEDNA